MVHNQYRAVLNPPLLQIPKPVVQNLLNAALQGGAQGSAQAAQGGRLGGGNGFKKVVYKMLGMQHGRSGRGFKPSLFQLGQLNGINGPFRIKPFGQMAYGVFQKFRSFVNIQPPWSTNHYGQGQEFLKVEGIQVPVEIVSGRLHHPSPLGRIGNLVEVAFQDLSL